MTPAVALYITSWINASCHIACIRYYHCTCHNLHIIISYITSYIIYIASFHILIIILYIIIHHTQYIIHQSNLIIISFDWETINDQIFAFICWDDESIFIASIVCTWISFELSYIGIFNQYIYIYWCVHQWSSNIIKLLFNFSHYSWSSQWN